MANWGNDNRNDNYIRFNGKNHTTKEDLLKTFEGTGYTEDTWLHHDNSHSDIKTLFNVEADAPGLAPLNGAYSWNEGAFIWQHQ